MRQIKVGLNKKKLILLLLGGAGFVFFSTWFIVKPYDFVNFLTRDEKIVYTVGIVGVIVFGFGTIMLFIKFLDKNPGLIIDKAGVTDNTTTNPVGFIPWKDITKIEVKKINSISILLIYLKNPNDYILKSSSINRLGLKKNMRTYGTPITITSLSLDCSFAELERLLLDSYNEVKQL